MAFRACMLTAAAATLATAGGSGNSAQGRTDDPVPTPGSVVQLGNARFTVLTPALIRMEYAGARGGNDDRATLSVINRALPVPQFTSIVNASYVSITTSMLHLEYTGTGSGGNVSTCNDAQSGMDQVGGQRVPDYPNGLSLPDQGDCCAMCDDDAYCSAWVFAPNTAPPGENCWLMYDVQATAPTPGRVFGGSIMGMGFNATNLRITLLADGTVWTPGTNDTGNLNGTYSALDCYSTPMECYNEFFGRMGKGLLSRDGWALVDDSGTLRFQPNASSPYGGVWWNNTAEDSVDWYFLGYGSQYRTALRDWASVSGAIAMPPRSAFGPWWSRYWTYSEQSITQEVLNGYANYSIPLSHFVMDMDWHDEFNSPNCSGWGGYSVNQTLFPNPQAWYESLHTFNNTVGHPLKVLLNVHPQTGVDHCQPQYAAFAVGMGVDPSTNVTIACDMGNPTFVDLLYSIYLDAEPLNPIDAWWTDYGGCGTMSGDGTQVQLWSNFIFNAHQQYIRGRRPLVLSRYGSYGNQRYALGFSGDTFQDVSALSWEIQTTQTAANVLFAYWSHDIGGFHNGQGCPGDADPTNITGTEVFLRWVQAGAVFPIMRTHCDHCVRTIWSFPLFTQLRDAFLLRNFLVPYIYTSARNAYDVGVAPVHPLYYDHPTDDQAFVTAATQYMFGDAILAAPITSMVDATNTTDVVVYLPAGRWYTWNGSETYSGPLTVSAAYGFSDMPLFIRDGFLLPTQTLSDVYGDFPSLLVWMASALAASANGTVYEDEGDSVAYQSAGGAVTEASLLGVGGSYTLTVSPVTGTFAGMPSTRAYGLQLRGAAAVQPGPPSSVTCNGATVPNGSGSPGWYMVSEAQHSLAGPAGSLIVTCAAADVRSTTVIEVGF